MSDNPKLKPCPFCGSDDVSPECFHENDYAQSLCNNCLARGPWVDQVGDYKRPANRWNERTDPDIKPLPWENFDGGTYWAHSIVGTYRVEDRDHGVVLRRGEEIIRYIDEGGEDWGAWGSIEKAQMAANADYSSRILSALN